MLPPIRAAGADPGPQALVRAHYRAMAAAEVAPPDRWWSGYLRGYVAACGVRPAAVDDLVIQMSAIHGFTWTYVPAGTTEALRRIVALGVPVGIVSNASGDVADVLRNVGVCYARGEGEDGDCSGAGIEVAAVIDSAVVGVEKPDPRIFRLALDALGVTSGEVIHVGDSLRFDVAGAIAAGVRPVHLDPYGDCPGSAGHEHIRHLGDLVTLIERT